MQCGRWNEAESLFATAVETNPADERAHHHLSEILWRRGLQEQAIWHMEESVRLSGGHPQRLVELGELYLQRGDLDRAWQQAEAAIRAQRKLAAAWALRGDIFRRRQRLDEAMTSYHRALTYQSHYPHVQVALAEIYGEKDRPRRSLATLELLAEQYGPAQTPTNILALQGVALKSLSRHDDAVEVLARARDRGNASANLLFELSEAQWLAGDAASAGLTVHTALARDPSHEPSRQLQRHIQARQRTMTAGLER